MLAGVPDFLPISLPTRLADLVDVRDSPEGYYAIHREGIATQLLFVHGTDPNVPLAVLVPLDVNTLARAESLIRFWRGRHGRRALPDTRMTPQQRRRLRLMMQAVDGRTNGASYREIAVAIYGASRVASDPWKTSPLRDSVIGLIEGGSAMVAGGYLNLLHHRRRS